MSVDAIRKSQVADNQGKCCDAVLRVLEQRLDGRRTGVSFPERETQFAPVELVCSIGDRCYALEHTKLEGYPDQLKDGINFVAALEPLECELLGKLPAGAYFQLAVPTEAFRSVDPKSFVCLAVIASTYGALAAVTTKCASVC